MAVATAMVRGLPAGLKHLPHHTPYDLGQFTQLLQASGFLICKMGW